MPKLFPFLAAALGWLIFGGGLCAVRGGAAPFGWFTLIWSLCILDLLALARVVSGMLTFAAGTVTDPEKRVALGVQTSVWGLLKLACLGTLGATVFVGRNIPALSLFAGVGTIVVVPLVGGLIWSQKVLNKADKNE